MRIFSVLLALVGCGGSPKKAASSQSLTLTADRTTLTEPGRATLTAAGTPGLTRIDFNEGDSVLATASAAPATLTLDITVPGARTFVARGYDAAGVSVDSNPITITGSFNADRDSPFAIKLTANTTALAVGETARLTANATDNVGVARFELYEGANKVGEDTSSPFTFEIAFTAAGARTFTARAFDATGNNADSNAVTVTASQPVLWHADYAHGRLRGFAESRWASSPTAGDADITLDLAACDNAKPNALVQDFGGNLIFTDDGNGRVVRLAADRVKAGGAATPADCQTAQSGLASAIGVALDADGRSVFVGHAGGISYLRVNANDDGFDTAVALVNTAGSNKTFSGLLTQGDRLFAVNYANDSNVDATVSVYLLNAERTTATLLLDFVGEGQDYALPEGVAIASGRLWVSSNSGDNILGVALTDIDAKIASNPGTRQVISTWKLLFNTPPASSLHCPGGLRADSAGNLWVNVQGASDVNADCGNGATAPGNVYKFSAAQLGFAGAASDATPALQLRDVASVPGFGGLWFGH